MMKEHSGKKILFFISVIMLFCVSATIAFMPFASRQKENNFMIPIYVIGGLFWLSIFIGYGSFLVLNHKRKNYYKTSGDNSNQSRSIGLVCVWSNLPAKIFDVLTGVSILVLITVLFKNNSATQLTFSLIAIFFFSLNMHGLFNGVNYKYYVKIDSRREKEI